jgi:hypothetical protein
MNPKNRTLENKKEKLFTNLVRQTRTALQEK